MKKNWLFFLLLLASPIIYFSCSKSSSTDTLVGNWSWISDFKGVGRSGATCFTIGDSVYIGLGYNSGNTPRYLQDFYKYDYKTNQWTAIKPFPGAGRSDAVAFSANNKGYVGTGYDGNNYCSDFYEYTPATNTWKKVASLGTFGRRNAVAFSIDNSGYVGTGYSGNYLSDFWKFTPNADTGSWTAIPDMPTKRSNSVTFVLGGKGYVVTGDNNGTYLNSFYRYNPASQVWEELRKVSNVSSDSYDDNYNIIRSNAVAFTNQSKAYITCGTTSGVRGDTWEYNPADDTWVQKTSFEGTSRTEALGFSVGNRLYFTTGRSGSNYYDDVWEFKPDDTYDANN
jgi:N-acetylneuraminic acid mutarotase